MSNASPLPTPIRTAAALTAVLVAATILYVAREVLIPIALAVVLTFLLAPLVRRLERLRMPRPVAVLLAVGLSTLFLGGMGWVMEEQVVGLAERLPEFKTNLLKKVDELRPSSGGMLGQAGEAISELAHKVAGEPSAEASSAAAAPTEPKPLPVKVVEPPTAPLVYAKNLIGPIISPLATAGIVVVFSIFMLIKREDVRNRFIRLVGQSEMHVTTPALDDAAQRISRYLLMQSITNGSAGLLIGAGLYFLHVPGALVWGLLIAFMRFLPYVGILVAAALPVAISLSASPGWSQVLMVIGLILVVELVIGNAVEPLLFGSHTGVSPLAILAAAVFWTWLWGPVGLLLATPLTVCLAVAGRHVPPLAFLDVLLGDEPVLTPEARLYQRVLAGDAEEAGDIIESFAKDKPLSEVYDRLVVPAIRLAESVRHRGGLSEDHDLAVREMLSVVIEDMGDLSAPGPAAGSSDPAERGLVICLPARDSADQLVARMLARLLSNAGVQAEVPSAEALTGEMMEAVATRQPAVVCISAVPPGSAVHTRVLCKRLRAKFPDLAIVVGLWDPNVNVTVARERLEITGAVQIVTQLQQAVDQIRSLAGYAGGT